MTSPDADGAPAYEGQRSFRWAITRLVGLWAPIAAVLALALLSLLDARYEPWYWRNRLEPGLEVLPSQLLFTLSVVVAGRFETARSQRGPAASSAFLIDYWATAVLLIGLAWVALWWIANTGPVLQ